MTPVSQACSEGENTTDSLSVVAEMRSSPHEIWKMACILSQSSLIQLSQGNSNKKNIAWTFSFIEFLFGGNCKKKI